MKKKTKVKTIIVVAFGLLVSVVLVQFPQLLEKRAAPMCPVDGARCLWDSGGDGISYTYEIYDVNANAIVSKGTTQNTGVSFTPIGLHQYRCSVLPVNLCGAGTLKTVESICNTIITPSVTIEPGRGGVFEPTSIIIPYPTDMVPFISTPSALPVVTDIPNPTITLEPQPTVESIPTIEVIIQQPTIQAPGQSKQTQILLYGSTLSAWGGVILLVLVVIFWIGRIIQKKKKINHDVSEKK